MIIYEVNLDLDCVIKSSFDTWLKGHIAEILQLPGFTKADWYGVDSDNKERINYSIQYHLKDRNSLDNYLKNHSARLREYAERHFSGKFTVTRRILFLAH